MATMDVKDVIGDNLAKILEATAGKKRHAELAEAVNALVASLRTGAFVVSSSDLDNKKPAERSPGAGGLPDDRVAELLVPVRLALSSRSPKIIDATLASVQKLIAHGFVRGDADLPPPGGAAPAVSAAAGEAAPSAPEPEPSESRPERDSATPARDETRRDDETTRVSTERSRAPLADAHAAELVELVCAASDVPDETVELQMLKCLLTAVSSSTFRVRARALLRVVRACVNAYLGSASEVNQTTAKASLTQMLAAVFHRLETRSRRPDAPAPAIVVADVFSSSLARRREGGTKRDGAENAGLDFSRRPVSAAALAAANAVKPTEEAAAAQATHFVQGFIDKVSADLAAAAAVAAGEDTDDLVAWTPASAAAQHREVTERAFDDDGDATPAKRGRGTAGFGGKDSAAADSASDDVSSAGRRSASGNFPEESSSEEASASAEDGASAEVSTADEDEGFVALEEDAFLVFRALCKLAKKPGDLTNPAVARGKTLSLELLRILLENAGPAFRRSRRLGAAVSEYLCDAVVVCASQTAVPAAHGLALCAFLAALKNFRHTLKAEIAVFFPALLLDPLRGDAGDAAPSSATSFQRRAVLLACARELCRDPRLLADVFVNYDCDLDSTNLVERLVEALARAAGGSPEPTAAEPPRRAATGHAGATSAPSTAHHPDDLEREQSLRLEALECLVVLLESLRDWVAGADDPEEAEDVAEKHPERGARDAKKTSRDAPGSGSGADPAPDASPLETPPGTLAGIEAMKASKTEYQSAISLFNAKPKKGVAAMQKLGRCGTTPAEVAAFLRDAPDLDKTVVGDYLGERDEGCLAVMHAYVDAMDFRGMALDEAIRAFLAGFRLPGESQKIDRLMEKFAERFCVANPGAYKSADTAYVLAFSVIMLNTDAHNPQVKHKMTKEGFLRNNRGIDDGADVPAAHLEELYDRIVSNEIRMKDDDLRLLAEKAELNASKSAASASASASQSINRAMKDMSNRLGVDMLISLMGTQKKTVHEVDTSEFMARVRERAARDAAGSFQRVRDPNCAGIMFAQFRDACFATFRDAFLAVGNEHTPTQTHIVDACLAGYLAAARLASATASAEALRRCAREAAEMAAPRRARAGSGAPATLNATKRAYAYARKNAEAMRCVVELAKREGGAFDEKSWEYVLVAASRYDLIFSAAAGFDEAGLFGGAPAEADAAKPKSARGLGPGGKLFGDSGSLPRTFASPFKNAPALADVFGGAGGVFGGSASSDESPFAHLKRRSGDGFAPPGTPDASSVPGKRTDSGVSRDDDDEENVREDHGRFFDDLDDPEFIPPSPAAFQSLTPDAVSAAYLTSASLDGDAALAFTRALCAVSAAELASRTPRVCSLAKLVEVAHLNMDRVRFVWSRMWAVMSDFFTEACCHATPEVAMFAADSLRQLATRFLERGELANYSFQNEFLKPFAIVARRSRSASIREFIVRCASSMVSGQAHNVKSGWKSVFAVLTAGASDERPETASLAFEIVERVIREHFDHITETDPSTFADCVDCLIAFTRHAGDGADGVVALNAVAFLRFCALKLADGAIGDLEMGVESAAATNGVSVSGQHADDPRGVERLNGAPAAPRARGATAFTEADAHVFYWFPLLKGLSDLTFDARGEIRRSAPEVLFDILDFHGERFSPGFWGKVYDDVLLPIFDHVRVPPGPGTAGTAGTETGTEAETRESEKRETRSEDSQEEASWLFQTTQRCLDLLVDLTLKHHARVVTTPSPRGVETLAALVALFAALATDARARVASCGVGAMHRLLSGAGDALDADGWSVAVDALAGAMAATTPAGFPFREPKSFFVRGAARGSPARGEARAAIGETESSRVARCETCALLARVAAETYFARGAVLKRQTLETLVGALISVAEARVAEAGAATTETSPEAARRVAAFARLEVEASRATLAVLLHLHAAATGTHTSAYAVAGERDADVSDAQAACGAATRGALTRLAMDILDRHARDVEGVSGDASSFPAETFPALRAPLAADALRALARLDDDAFRRALFSRLPESRGGDASSSPGSISRDSISSDETGAERPSRDSARAEDGYGALTRLARLASTPKETRAALSDVLARRVGPLASRALRRDAR